MTPSDRPEDRTDAATGLPLLRSWPALYTFVLAFFAVVVALLVALSRTYS